MVTSRLLTVTAFPLVVYAIACSTTPPSETIEAAYAPSCQAPKSISVDERREIEAKTQASNGLLSGSAAGSSKPSGNVKIEFVDTNDNCAQVRGLVQCVANMAKPDPRLYLDVQRLWKPTVDKICSEKPLGGSSAPQIHTPNIPVPSSMGELPPARAPAP